MYLFPAYFAKRTIQSPFLRKFLKALAKKICDVMWGWEILTWRTEHSNYLPKRHHGCNLRSVWLYVAVHMLAKIFQGWVFHRTPVANAESKWFQWIQNINRAVPLPKDENFFVCSNHFGKNCFYRDLRVGNIVFASLLRQSLDDP